MMPCKFCNPKNEPTGNPKGGLKQKGKTVRDGTKGGRLYECQDCGTVWKMVFDTSTKQVHDEPVLVLVKEGRQ